MGVRRAALKAVDWVAFAERVPPNQRTIPSSECILCLCRLTSLPEKPVTIDRTYYRSAVAKAGMVEEFEKTVRHPSLICKHTDGRPSIMFICIVHH
uniref:Uncharacterized protein n=1 Tax=Gadus morhua TaxID=8049 RepID=A0A8C5F7C1_GADMO